MAYIISQPLYRDNFYFRSSPSLLQMTVCAERARQMQKRGGQGVSPNSTHMLFLLNPTLIHIKPSFLNKNDDVVKKCG